MSVRPSLRVEQIDSHRKEIREISHLGLLLKFVYPFPF